MRLRQGDADAIHFFHLAFGSREVGSRFSFALSEFDVGNGGVDGFANYGRIRLAGKRREATRGTLTSAIAGNADYPDVRRLAHKPPQAYEVAGPQVGKTYDRGIAGLRRGSPLPG
jgi:hypothetical protein